MNGILLITGALAALITLPWPVALEMAPQTAMPAAIPAEPAALSEAEQSALLKDVAKAMTSVKTAQGRFEQLSPDFNVTSGRFALSRPGKVRFDYDAPNPLLLVADGTTVALQDSELETTDRVPLGSTPLSLVLDDSIDFESDTEVLEVARRNGMIGITLRDPSDEVDGTLTLLLNDATRELTGWRTQDSGGNITSVQLVDVTYDVKLNPRLFVVRDFDDQ